MRVVFASGLAAATLLLTCGGCSSMPSFLPTFGKAKNKASDTSKLANAPPAPQLSTMAGTSPTVTMPEANSGWSNLPVYPGTNYPQTPYPATASPPPTYTAQAPAGNYGAMPPAAAGAPANPYAGYPPAAAQTQPYAAAQPQPYGQPPAAPYGQPAPNYAQQPANPYGQPPYNAPAQPQNAANPYSNSYTR